MDIVLDTNIYQSNFSLKSNQIDVLSAYLRKTSDHLIVPYIVAQELLRNYKTSLKKSIKDIEKVAHPFHNCVTTPQLKAASEAIFSLGSYKRNQLETDAAAYLEHIRSTIENVQIQDSLPALNLNAIVEKGLDKKKPFKQSGEGLKDTILWESVIEHCVRNNFERVIFITNNSNDFGNGSLEQNLLEQAAVAGKQIIYYNGLEQFINSEFATIANFELTAEQLDAEYLKLLLSSEIPSRLDLQEFYNTLDSADIKYGDYQGIYSFNIDEVKNVIVKDIDADFKYIYANLICTVHLVLVCERYHTFTNQITGDFDYDLDYELETVEIKLNVEVSMKQYEGDFEELQINKLSFHQDTLED